MASTFRILAENIYMDNNTWNTGINNNDLIIGPSGSGKTRNYVKPNIMQCNESIIVADTKGTLCEEMSPLLKQEGYHVICISFKDMKKSDGYNPLNYIRYDKKTKSYSEKDILTISSCIIPEATYADPYWNLAARQYLTCFIAYVMNYLPAKEHTLEYVLKMFELLKVNSPEFDILMEEVLELHPDGMVAKQYRTIKSNRISEKTNSSIVAVLSTYLDPLSFYDAIQVYRKKHTIEFQRLGKEKTAVFLEISDTDRSLDALVNVFYTQALQVLCESADKDYATHRLDVPVRIILDDFAANAYIPQFDKIISVIRSREIYVSVILQSITQLESMYSNACAKTIINNCDNCLYLGGQDPDTAMYIGEKANLPSNRILEMPLSDALLFCRGQKYRKVQKFDITKHEKYELLMKGEQTRNENNEYNENSR